MLKRQALGLAWRLNVAWCLALAQWHKAVEQREDRCHGLAAGQKSKRLLEKDLLFRLHVRRHKSL